MLRKISIVPRLVGTVLTGSAIIGLVAFVVVFSYIEEGLHTAKQRELVALHSNVLAEIDALGNQALAGSALIAGMPVVQQAMKARDRDALSVAFVPTFATLKKEHKVRQFQFHLPPATSFLRVHKPAKFGDDLSGFRKTVLKTNNQSVPVKGLEIGVAGLGVRGVVPIRADGAHVGSVEWGMSFGQAFFDEYTARHDVGLSLHLVRNGRLEAFASTFGDESPLTNEQLSPTLEGEPVSGLHTIGDIPFGLYADVVRDFSGNVVGVLTVGKDGSFFASQLASIRWISFAVGALALVAFALVIWLIGRNVAQPLQQATQMMHEISHGDGNLDVALKIRARTRSPGWAVDSISSSIRFATWSARSAARRARSTPPQSRSHRPRPRPVNVYRNSRPRRCRSPRR